MFFFAIPLTNNQEVPEQRAADRGNPCCQKGSFDSSLSEKKNIRHIFFVFLHFKTQAAFVCNYLIYYLIAYATEEYYLCHCEALAVADEGDIDACDVGTDTLDVPQRRTRGALRLCRGEHLAQRRLGGPLRFPRAENHRRDGAGVGLGHGRVDALLPLRPQRLRQGGGAAERPHRYTHRHECPPDAQHGGQHLFRGLPADARRHARLREPHPGAAGRQRRAGHDKARRIRL